MKDPEQEPSFYDWQSADALDAHDFTVPAVIKLLPPGKLQILDIGCGNGFLTAQLSKLGHDVIGCDRSEEGISIAKKTYPGVSFHVHSAYEDLHAISETVDVVVSSEVIEHLFSPTKYLLNAHNIIRHGGHIILTTPYHGYMKNLALSLTNHWDKHFTVDWEGGHIKFFSERTLTKMLSECGFTDTEFNNVGRVMWLYKSMVCRSVKL